MAIRICVKGNEKEGTEALASRDIREPKLVRVTQHNTFWDVPEEERSRVIYWFHEPEVRTDRGVQPGTLLHHN